jgi:hypothetical protein
VPTWSCGDSEIPRAALALQARVAESLLSSPIGTNCQASESYVSPIPPDLAHIISSWPHLTPHVRKSLMALVMAGLKVHDVQVRLS